MIGSFSCRLTGAIVVWTELESLITLALVRAQGVDASAIVAYVRVALTFVDIDAIIPIMSQREAEMADALETALQIVARAVVADTRSFVTLVDINAIMLAGTKLVASWTHTLEVALLIDALCVPTAGIRYLELLGLLNNNCTNYFYSYYCSHQLIQVISTRVCMSINFVVIHG
jgi:hypothetical protein